MDKKDIILRMNKIEALISYGYEKYKASLSVDEKKMCNMYLYEQGEYEEALTNLTAMLRNHKVEIDPETKTKFKEAYDLMNISYQEGSNSNSDGGKK
jgi:hypothetical protein